MRKIDPPAVATDAGETIAHKRKRKAAALQHRRDNAVKAIRSDDHIESPIMAQRHEAGECGIDFQFCDHVVQIAIRRSDEIDLARQAFTRSDAAGDPFLFDLAPFGKRKSLENQIGGVLTDDRSVKIQDDRCSHKSPYYPRPTTLGPRFDFKASGFPGPQPIELH
jgi:hypothetical protein